MSQRQVPIGPVGRTRISAIALTVHTAPFLEVAPALTRPLLAAQHDPTGCRRSGPADEACKHDTS